MEVAEEEGMPGPQPKLLQPIRDALHALNYWPETMPPRPPLDATYQTDARSGLSQRSGSFPKWRR